MKKILIFLLLMIVGLFSRSAQEAPSQNDGLQTVHDSKVTVPTPSNRVHRAGLLWMNTTNMGYFGNPDTYDDPCTYQNAVSGEMPGGSGTDYLYLSGLMFGGYLDSAEVDISGTLAKVFQGPLVSTAYEGWTGAMGWSDMPKEMWPVNFDQDPSGATLGRIRETSNVEGRINCLFEDVYDPASTAEEQFSIMYTDKFVQRTPYTGMDDYDKRDHIPLGIEVRQKSYAWSYEYAQKFIIVDYTLYNRNSDGKDIYDFFMGMNLDCDIGMTGGAWTYNHADDISGFIQKWEGYIDPATGAQRTVDLNLAWAADNDGRNYTGTSFYTATGEPAAGAPLDGATGVMTVKILRNPNPNLRYAYNRYIADSENESRDWSPHWKTGLHSDWMYDLTPSQKGYDDTNSDGLINNAGQPLAGGRVEGRPVGDKGKYMVMSNDEFDYTQYDIIDIDLGRYSDPSYMQGTPYAQAEKWQEWFDPSETLPGPDDVYDGEIEDRNDIANGSDSKYILSFGPLGTEAYTNVAVDTDNDGLVDDHINKTIWKFAYGDSLKLTIAYIASEDFHTSLDQDPNYSDPSAIDPADGLDPSLYDKGWYDALYNVVWCERMYDIPMYDTPISKYGETKGDGWYGEDVGIDGIFANIRITTECWWTDPMTEYGGPDEGESNFELDDFTSSFTDTYGHLATSEDDLLPFGREIADEIFGITGNQSTGDGDGYGYMVRYGNIIDPHPEVVFGEWVRYGFDNGRLDPGDGVPDFTGPPPPPSPKIEVSYQAEDLIIDWQSHEFFIKVDETESYAGPEHYLDPFSRIRDFEGYQIQVSPDNNALNFVEIFSVDNENYVYENVAETGDYLDIPYSRVEYDSLVAEGLSQITAEGKIFQLAPFGDNIDLIGSYSQSGVYEYTATPTTKIINEGTAFEETVDYYMYRFIMFNYQSTGNYIAVTSSDFGYPKMGIPALESSAYNNMTNVSSIEDQGLIPIETNLYQNYPNPFNPETKISFSIGKDTNVKLLIYNVAGQLVKKVIDEEMKKGIHSINLKMYDMNSGVYYYTLKTDDKKLSKKMVVIK